MTAVPELIERIESYCRDNGIAVTTFGRRTVNDGKLVSRLRAGGQIQLATLARIESTLASGPMQAAE